MTRHGVTRLGAGPEFDLIRQFLAGRAAATGAGVRVGPGDDCTILDGGRLALSLDLTIEDVHFRRAWLAPREIGFRAAAAALSDLAAMAATPVGLLAGLAVTSEDAEEVAPEVMLGVAEAAEAGGAALLGGDLTRSPGPIILDIAVAGRVDEPVLRSGARPGDSLWVTGRLGAAAAAVAAWLAGGVPSAAARSAFSRPAPRLREARWLAQHATPHALIDLSDGLAGDAGHLAAASGVRLEIDAAAVPVHPAAGDPSSSHTLDRALRGGEDYELLFAAPGATAERVAEAFTRAFGIPLTRVGSVVAGEGVVLRHADGAEQPLEGGFDHFRRAVP